MKLHRPMVWPNCNEISLVLNIAFATHGKAIFFCCASIITRRVMKEKFEIKKSRNTSISL